MPFSFLENSSATKDLVSVGIVPKISELFYFFVTYSFIALAICILKEIFFGFNW